MDHNTQGQGQGHGRRNFHRGRRSPDRRGPERRGPQPQGQEQAPRSDVDVEQIMRDIRARIAQHQGIELSNEQIQDLAARRLESILDPRSVKPALLDQLRRAAGSPAEAAPPTAQPPYAFEDTTLYDSPNGFVRFMRRLLNPLLKLFFNPNPLIHALNIQARVNMEAAARDAERDRRQAEWNALHYEILQRLATEISRVTIEEQALSMKVEALSAKIDFNERRVRGIEGVMHQARPAPRRESRESVEPIPALVVAQGDPAALPETSAAAGVPGATAESTRRRRRRRRGRRGAGVPGDVLAGGTEAAPLDPGSEGEVADQDDGPDEDDLGIVATEDDSIIVAEALARSEVEPSPIEALPQPGVPEAVEEERLAPSHPTAPADGEPTDR